MNIILLGAPGSGKGTQAELIQKKFNLFHLQTGQIARAMAEKSKRLKEIVESGKLVPEEEMSMYVFDHLATTHPKLENILFEGFPRFVSQYEALENFLTSKGKKIDLVISLDISQKVAVERISSRRICTKCGEVYNLITNPPPQKDTCKCGGRLIRRKDDNPLVVKERFIYYKENTKKLVDYLAKGKKLFSVNAELTISEIFEIISKKLQTL